MTNTSLQNLKIIITRPRHQAKNLAALIQELGGIPILIPCIGIEEIDISEQMRALKKNGYKADIVIFLSANAVNASLPYWRSLNTLPTIIAIGSGTAQALQEANLPVNAIPAEFSSEGLLKISLLQHTAGKNILLCSGENPRPLLSEILLQRGAQVTPLICYRRKNINEDLNAILKNYSHIDVSIATSQEILKNWHKMITEAQAFWLLSLPLIIINPTHNTLARQLGFKQILQAENATDAAIIHVLLQWKPIAADGTH